MIGLILAFMAGTLFGGLLLLVWPKPKHKWGWLAEMAYRDALAQNAYGIEQDWITRKHGADIEKAAENAWMDGGAIDAYPIPTLDEPPGTDLGVYVTPYQNVPLVASERIDDRYGQMSANAWAQERARLLNG